MQYRPFGRTGIRLSEISMGGHASKMEKAHNYYRGIRIVPEAADDLQKYAKFYKERTEQIACALDAGINFFADRDSIYEASIIAGAQIEGEIVTGRMLIERIKEDRVKMALIHVDGGSSAPHQLASLVDYGDFRSYLIGSFDLLTVFDRVGQRIEVYKRK